MAGTDETAGKNGRAKRSAQDPAAMAADIERTREDLAETLDAIADKVSPKRVAKRTTKKVTDAVRETAADAATAVKGTAGSAKGKVTRSEQSWAPPPTKRAAPAAPVAPVAPVAEPAMALPSAAPVEVPNLAPAATAYPARPAHPLVRPEYVVAGVFAALVAWALVRRR